MYSCRYIQTIMIHDMLYNDQKEVFMCEVQSISQHN